MKYKVMYTAGAKRDLRNIFRYISEELLAPENAAGQTDRIMAAIRKLDTMPNRNRLYEEEPCLLYTSPSPRDRQKSRMPSSA